MAGELLSASGTGTTIFSCWDDEQLGRAIWCLLQGSEGPALCLFWSLMCLTCLQQAYNRHAAVALLLLLLIWSPTLFQMYTRNLRSLPCL